MRIVVSERAIRSLADAPYAVRRAFEKQIGHLEANLRHSSLRAKKSTNRETSGRLGSIATGAFISRLKMTSIGLRTSSRIPS